MAIIIVLCILAVCILLLNGIDRFYKKMGIPFLSIFIAVILLHLVSGGIVLAIKEGWIKTDSNQLIPMITMIAQGLSVIAIWNITYNMYRRVWSTGGFILSLLLQIAFVAASKNEFMQLYMAGDFSGFITGVKQLMFNASLPGILAIISVIGYLLVQAMLSWKIARCFSLGRKDELDVVNTIIHIIMFPVLLILPPVGMILLGVLPFRYHKVENV